MICPRHPLVPIAVAFILGTVAGLSFEIPILLYAIPLIPLAVIVSIKRKIADSFRYAAFLILVAVFASAYAAFRDGPLDAASAHLHAIADTGKSIKLSGEVTSLRPPVSASHGELKHRFKLKNVIIADPNGIDVLPVAEPVALVWYGKRPERGGYAPKSGMRLEVSGKIFTRRNADPAADDLDALFMVSRIGATRVISANATSNVMERWRTAAAESLSLGLNRFPEERSLILAMVLGYRSELDRRLTKAFRYAGTIHIFAISGLHIALIAEILLCCFGLLGIKRYNFVYFLVPILSFYIFATGGQPSALRAGLMVALYFFVPVLGRRPDSLNVVALTVLTLLLLDPIQIRELSFILSFSMVVGLILFCPKFEFFFRKFVKYDRQLERLNLESVAYTKASWLQKFPFTLKSWFVRDVERCVLFTVVSVSVTAAFVSLPLTSYFFGYLTVYSLFSNILIVPLSWVVMLSASVSVFVGYITPYLSLPLNFVACFGAYLMKNVSILAASLPGAAFEVAFPLWGVALWYAALALLVRKSGRKK